MDSRDGPDARMRENDAASAPSAAPSGSSARTLVDSSQRVVDTVLDGILEGRYVPGQRVVEAELTRRLGISRGPVREAFKRLAAQRILVVTPHRGARIRAFTRAEVRDALSVMEALLSLAARLAARADDEENRTAFHEALREVMAKCTQRPGYGFLRARNRFYHCLIAMSGNAELPLIMPVAQTQLIRIQLSHYLAPADRDRHLQDYQAIGNAVLDGDPNRAQRCMRLHLLRSWRTVRRLPDAAFAAAVKR